MNDSKRAKLYDNLISTGKVSENEIGTKDDFVNSVSDKDGALYLYKNLRTKFDQDEIGDADKFWNYLSVDFVPSKSGPLPAGQGNIPLPTDAGTNPLKNPFAQDNNIPSPLVAKSGQSPMPSNVVQPIEKEADPESVYNDFVKQNQPFLAKYEDVKRKLGEAEKQNYGMTGKEASMIGLSDMFNRAKVSKEDREFYNQNKDKAEQMLSDRKTLQLQKDFATMSKQLNGVSKDDPAVQRFWKGITQSGLAKDFLSMGMTEFDRNVDMEALFRKANEHPDKLNDTEKGLLKVYESYQDAMSDDKGFAFKAGQTFKEMVPFIATMMGTGAAGSGITKGLQSVMKTGTWAAAKGTAKGVAKYGAKKLAEGAIFNTLRTPFTPTFYNALSQKTLDNYSVQDGQVVKDPEAESFGRSVYDAYVQNTLEYFTESLGGAVDAGVLSPILSNKRISKMFANNASWLNRVTKNPAYIATKNILDKAQIQGIIPENVEEISNAFLSSALTGSEDWQQFKDNPGELLALTTLNTALLGGSITGAQLVAGGAGARIQRNKINRNARQSLSGLDEVRLNVTDESLARQIAMLKQDIEAGEFVGPDADISRSKVAQSLEEVRKSVDNLEPEQVEQIMPVITRAVTDNAIKAGAYEGIVAAAEEQLGGAFVNKKNPKSIIVGSDIDGQQFYILDQLDEVDDNNLVVVRPIEGGETKTMLSSDINDVVFADTQEFIDNWLSTKDVITPLVEQQEAEQSPVETAPVQEMQADPSTIEQGNEYLYEGEPVKVIDVTEEGVGIEDVDGNQYIVDASELSKTIEQPVQAQAVPETISTNEELPPPPADLVNDGNGNLTPLNPEQVNQDGSVENTTDVQQTGPQIPLTQDGTPDYDQMSPDMMVTELAKQGMKSEDIADIVGGVVKSLQSQRKSVEKKQPKSINDAVVRKRTLQEIDNRINALNTALGTAGAVNSISEEEITPELLNQRAGQQKIDKEREDFNRLLTDVRTHNAQTPARRKKANITGLLTRANDLGYTVKPDIDGTVTIVDNEGNPQMRVKKTQFDTDYVNKHKILSEYEPEFIEFANTALMYPDFMIMAVNMGSDTFVQGSINIRESKKTQAANELLDELYRMFQNNEIVFSSETNGDVVITIPEFIEQMNALEDDSVPVEELEDMPDSIMNNYEESLYLQQNTEEDGRSDISEETEDLPGDEVRQVSQVETGEQVVQSTGENQQGGIPGIAVEDEELSQLKEEIANAEAEVDTNPTEAQKEAGNYKMGHVTIQGLDITIENPKGSTRSGISADGKAWSTVMNNSYGYVLGTTGKDADHIDVFLGENPLSEKAFVIDQVNKDGSFDEHKVMLGFDTVEEAEAAYMSNYEKGWQGLGNITETTVPAFTEWAKAGTRRIKPFAEYKENMPEVSDKVTDDLPEIITQTDEQRERVLDIARNNPLQPDIDNDSDILGIELSEAEQKEANEITEKLQDFGRKIGMARKDVAERGFTLNREKKEKEIPGWAKKYKVFQQKKGTSYSDWNTQDGKWEVAIVDGNFYKTVKKNFESEELAMAAIPLLEVSRNHRVYNSKDSESYSIYRSWSSGKLWEIKKGFKTREEALLYMATNPEEIINFKAGRVERPHLDKVERIGVERRKGNVDSEKFMQVFGFRGGEFGNWVAADERQTMLNFSYDALLDMAEVLGVPPKSLSLGGRLAIGFGSRGKGLIGAAAHFEPERGVINLTKISGAGSLSHEWFHAFDSYFGVMEKKVFMPNEDGVIKTPSEDRDYLSGDYYSNPFVRKEVIEAWDKVWNKMRYKYETTDYDLNRIESKIENAINSVLYSLASTRGWIAIDRNYGLRKKAATKEQLDRWDALVERIKNNDLGPISPRKTKKKYSFEQEYEVQRQLSDLSKEITGRERIGIDYNDLRRIELHNKELQKAKSDKTYQVKKNTTFYNGSKDMDESRSSAYWSTNLEMSARAFESYVYDKLKEAGAKNDYLVHSVNNNIYQVLYNAKPYPEGKERVEINSAFDDFFNILKTKVDESGNDILFRSPYFSSLADLDAINEKFNQDLQAQIEGKLPKQYVYKMGYPSVILKSATIPDLAIELTASRLRDKSIQENHPFDLMEVKDLPKAIQNPLAVFMSATHIGSYVIMTEISHNGRNFITAIEANKIKGKIEINDIRSIHYRSSNTHFANWINEGLLEYVDKKRMLEWLAKQRYNSAEVKQLFKHVTNVVNNFQNPTLEQGEISSTIETLSAELNTPVKVIKDITEIPASQVKKRKAKGWFDPKTGEIAVVLPNNKSVADVQATILHEVVAHKGLRGMLGSEFNPTMQRVFTSMPEGSQADYLAKYGDKATAAEEYCANIAEKDIEPTTWEKIKSIIKDAFRSIGIDLRITDADIEYMLWRSKNRLKSAATTLETVKDSVESDAMKEKIRFRGSDDTAPDTNDIKLSRSEKFVNAIQDRMIAGKKLLDEIKSRGGKIGNFSNFVSEETRSSSRAKAELDDFADNYYQPLMDNIGEWVKRGVEMSQTEDYMKAKHAPEVNRVVTSKEVRTYLSLRMRNDEQMAFLKDRSELFNAIIRDSYERIFHGYAGPEVSFSGLSEVEAKIAQDVRDKALDEFGKKLLTEEGNIRSGKSDEEAREIIDEFESKFKPEEITGFWDKVNRATRFSVDKSYSYGLISRETYEYTKTMYDYYVPLRGWMVKEDIDYSDVFGENYMGNEILNSVNKTAKGRQSEAESPLGYIGSMAETAIVSGNKNEVRRNAWRLIKNNDKMTDLFLIKDSWLVNTGTPEEPIWIPTYETPTQEQLDSGMARKAPLNTSYEWHKSRGDIEKHQVPVMIDGKRVLMEFKGELGARVASAINGTNVVRWQKIDGIAKVTRIMAALKTSKNPDFVLTNFIRDYFFGNMAYYIRGGNPLQLSINLGRAWKAIHKDFTHGKEDTYLKQMYEDFKMNGGETGYVHMLGQQDFQKKAEKMIREANNAGKINPMIQSRKAFKLINHSLDYLSHMSENAMRFTAYLTEVEKMMKKEGVDKPTEGMKKQAALAAKELTTNFNRKGTWSGTIGAGYAFFNASIQGTANYIKLAKENPVRFIKANLAILGLRTALHALCMLLSGDDDDDSYSALSDYIKENNFVIPTTGNKYITIPLPHGARAFTNIGPYAIDVINGKKEPDKATWDYLSNIISEVSPVNLVGLDKSAFLLPKDIASAVLTITPTAIRPWAEAAANIDFMGRPIERTNFLATDNDYIPRWKNAYASTNDILVGSAKYLNRLGGGNDSRTAGLRIDGKTGVPYRSRITGYFDVSPAYTEHILESYFGGAGRFVNDLYKTSSSLVKGDVPEKQNIPVFRRLYQEPFETSAMLGYYETRTRVNEINRSKKAAIEVGDDKEYAKLNSLYNNTLSATFDAYSKAMRNLVKAKEQLPEGDARIEQIDKAVNDLVVRLNAEVKTIDKRYNDR